MTIASTVKVQALLSTAAPATKSGWLHQLLQWAEDEIQPVENAVKNIWAEIEPEAVNEFESLTSNFLGVAVNAVTKQAQLVLSGQEKFSAACAEVIEAIEAAGKTWSQTGVAWLVNTALMILKMAPGVIAVL